MKNTITNITGAKWDGLRTRDGVAMDWMPDAVEVLAALPEDEQDEVARDVERLQRNIPVRGVGANTAFEILVALGRLIERETDGSSY